MAQATSLSSKTPPSVDSMPKVNGIKERTQPEVSQFSGQS